MNYFELLAPDFSLILLGFLLCRYTALNRAVWEQAEKLVFFVFFPVLLFHSIVKSPLDLSATSGLIMGGLTLAGSGIALAMAERLAGPEGLLLIAVLIGVCVPVFNMAAIWPMARHSETHFGRELLRNPFIIATVSGLLANLMGFHIPSWLEPSVSRIGAGSWALGLMAAGAGMRLGSIAQAKALSVAVLLIKHMVLPLVALLLSHALGLSKIQTLVLLAFSALPTAPTAYVLAARMGYNGPLVAGLVTLSTLMGMLSLPFAIALSTLRPWT